MAGWFVSKLSTLSTYSKRIVINILLKFVVNTMLPNHKMVIVICFILALTAVQGRPNAASYVTAKNRPLNIAHRGLSSILPENTMEAF